jgi:hypothetical protein
MEKLTKILEINYKNSKNRVLLESRGELTFQGNKFEIVVDVTESPTKQGVRLKFTPLVDVIRMDKSDVRVQLQQELNKTFSPSGMSVNVDMDVLEENTIGFILSVDDIKNVITKHFGNSTKPEENDEV